MKKRFLSIILAAVMTVGMLVSAIPAASSAGGALPFKDVPANEWYVDSVRFVWDRGIMNGTSPTTFGPEEPMTRGQIVTILSRMSGDNVTGMKKEMNFKDVRGNEYYADPIGWAVKNGIAKGMSATTFEPDTPVLRQEFAAFFVRYMDYKGIKLPDAGSIKPFPDKAKFPDWAVSDIETLQKTGLVKGDNLGNFNPGSRMTRAEIATVTKRFTETVFPTDPMYALIDAAVENAHCVIHGQANVQFGTADSLTEENLCAVIKDYVGLDDRYSVSADSERFNELRSVYKDAGNDDSVDVKLNFTFTNVESGESTSAEFNLSIRKDLWGYYTGAVPTGAMSLCWDDFHDEDLTGMADALEKMKEFDDETVYSLPPGKEFDQANVEEFFRNVTGLTDGSKYRFFMVEADGEGIPEGCHCVNVCFKAEYVSEEGYTYTYTVGCETVLRSIPAASP